MDAAREALEVENGHESGFTRSEELVEEGLLFIVFEIDISVVDRLFFAAN